MDLSIGGQFEDAGIAKLIAKSVEYRNQHDALNTEYANVQNQFSHIEDEVARGLMVLNSTDVIERLKSLYKDVEVCIEELVLSDTQSTTLAVQELIESFGPGEEGRFFDVAYSSLDQVGGNEALETYLAMYVLHSEEGLEIMDKINSGSMPLLPDVDEGMFKEDPDYVPADEWASDSDPNLS